MNMIGATLFIGLHIWSSLFIRMDGPIGMDMGSGVSFI
jgi:hypothetical protein